MSSSALPTAAPSAAAAAQPSPSPPRREGAPVVIDNIPLMRVPEARDLTAQERARVLVDRLEAALDATTEVPDVRLDIVGSDPVLSCAGVLLMTVTDRDAAFLRVGKPLAAVEYRTDLENGLTRVWKERNGLLLARALRLVAFLIALGSLLHVLILRAARHWLKAPGWFAACLVWLVVLSGSLLAFPDTRGVGHLITAWLLKPMMEMLCIALVALAVWTFTSWLLNRYFSSMLALHGDEENVDSRAPHRINAVHQAIGVMVDMVIAVLVMASLLSIFNVNASALLASAGIIGVALGVAAQDMLRDLVSGLNILFEDQFGVGDFIQAGGVGGEVVGFTLRATRIRNIAGSLITIPNGMMRTVENQSNEWSQADVQVRVSPESENVSHALAVMEQVGADMFTAEPDRILQMPTLLGIERVSPSAVTLRMLLKTAPSKQWGVRRDMLANLNARFENEGVATPRLPYLAPPAESSPGAAPEIPVPVRS